LRHAATYRANKVSPSKGKGSAKRLSDKTKQNLMKSYIKTMATKNG
jgi:hypothetical protein